MNYAGFWPRFAAIWLDFIFVLPLTAFTFWGHRHVERFDVYSLVPGILFGVFYSVYLVRRLGGTPGKRVMKLRIAKVDGSAIGYREAILRYLPEGAMAAGMSVAATLAALKMDSSAFVSASYMEGSAMLSDALPSWYMPLFIAFNLWVWGEFVVMLTNRKRRAIHDFIAGTVVLKEIPAGVVVNAPPEAVGARTRRVHPIFVLGLVGIIALAVFIKLGNPNEKYSQQKFWETATLADVKKVPQEALLPGNKNGSVLMWAASAAQDPRIITTLVARGADVNEADVVFGGTPLSGAAGYNPNPAIVDELVRLGAEVNKVFGSNRKTALIIAAELNPEPKVVEALLRNGADTSYTDATGRNALDQAIRFKNSTVIPVLEASMKEHASELTSAVGRFGVDRA